jgi:FkbM family methyltransferase
MRADILKEVGELVKLIQTHIDCGRARVILDVGSRDAEVAITFKKYYPNANIYAFECNPPAVDLCKRNIGNRADIFLVDKAVSDTNGLIEFYSIDPERTVTPHADGNIGASSLYIANPDYPYEKYYQNRILVEAITLEKWAKAAEVNKIDILWMDLQGAELKALKGLGNLIKNVKVIYTEVEYKEMYIGQPLFDDINQYIVSHGFSLHKQMNICEWFGNALYIRDDIMHINAPALLK